LRVVLAVVTGAGSGIGAACALEFARRRRDVVCVGRRTEALEATAREVEASGGRALAVPADVASASGVDSVVEAIGEGSVDALVHAAGRESLTAFDSTNRVEFDEVMSVNVAAPFFVTQALGPVMAEGAGIVFVSSIAASVGRALHSAYGASKAALIGLTKNLAAELAPRLRVNAVCPGATQTAMLDQFINEFLASASPEETEGLLAESHRVLLRRVAQPQEVAATIVHLALDATAVTGAVVYVDLGYSAG
jgi:3-oxoacyl-[acyl-carrier protein] reductase